MTKITNGVLLLQFFNTGLLILIVNADLADVSPLLAKFFYGGYYDYSPTWYENVGNTLLHTMFLNAFMPLVFELSEIM